MRHKARRFGTAAAAAGMAMAVVAGTGIGTTAAGASSTPFRILLMASLTTPYVKTNAQTEVVLSKAAVTVINKSGGVNGHKVVLTIVNDGGKPTTAVTNLEQDLNSIAS